MKAEHRKELETNILADKVGKLISATKEGPSRGFLFYILCALGALFVLFLIYRWSVSGKGENEANWFYLEEGSQKANEELVLKAPAENAGKAARLQRAYFILWNIGLKRLGFNPKQALQYIERAEVEYEQLAKDCKDDPVYLPEALYGLAVIEETRLLERKNRENLALVIDKYQDVVKANKDSAFAALALKRIDEMKDDAKGAERQDPYALVAVPTLCAVNAGG